MFSTIHSLVVLSTLAIAALGAAIPTTPRLQWSTPPSCLRGLATYDFKQCTIDLNNLINLAHASIKDIDIVGMKLVDVIGPAATILPAKLPVTHTCYPTTNLLEQNPDIVPERVWSDGDFVPFRLNIACDDQDRITSFSWH